MKHSGPARLLPFGLTNLLWAMSALPPGAVARHAELVDMLLGEVEALGGAAIGTRCVPGRPEIGGWGRRPGAGAGVGCRIRWWGRGMELGGRCRHVDD